MIEIKDVVKIYENSITALEKVNLKIEKGDFLYVTGESGAGKTTLLKLIHGDELPTSGEILYDAKPVLKQFPLYMWRRKISFAYQDYMLIEDRTVFENVTLPAQIKGESFSKMRSKARAVLDALKLKDKMYERVRNLSGGEKQRITIARALIANPDVLLLDEPTGNLDEDTAETVMRYIEAVNEQGTTVIMATHHFMKTNGRPKRIIKLHRGRIIRKAYV